MKLIDQVEKLLSDFQWHDNDELAAITHRFGALVHVLRKAGMKIQVERTSLRTWRYRRVRRGGP